MPTNKNVTLEHLTLLATRAKASDDVISARVEEIATEMEGIIAAGGEPNILEGVKVNGEALAIADKMVDILIATGEENGTITVNGAAVAIKGLADLAFKAKVSEADLDEALTAVIAAKATQADLTALEVRVATAEGKIQVLESAGFQTAEDVQNAIAAANHLKYEVVEQLPTAEEADANTWYMVMNAETGHYDIYGLLNGEVRLIDDTTIDLSGYSTTEAMQAWVTQQITALNIDQYATDEELQAVVLDVQGIQTALQSIYTKTEVDALLADKMNVADMDAYATDDEAAAAGTAAVEAGKATTEEVTAALDNVFPTTEG